MNAQSLWAGNDYAYVSYPSRGVTFYSGAKRVRVERVYKERAWGNDRMTTKVVVTNVETGRQFTTTARNIVDFWSDYEAERDRRAEIRRKEEEEREQRRRERQELKKRVEAVLTEHGIKGYVNVNGEVVIQADEFLSRFSTKV